MMGSPLPASARNVVNSERNTDLTDGNSSPRHTDISHIVPRADNDAASTPSTSIYSLFNTPNSPSITQFIQIYTPRSLPSKDINVVSSLPPVNGNSDGDGNSPQPSPSPSKPDSSGPKSLPEPSVHDPQPTTDPKPSSDSISTPSPPPSAVREPFPSISLGPEPSLGQMPSLSPGPSVHPPSDSKPTPNYKLSTDLDPLSTLDSLLDPSPSHDPRPSVPSPDSKPPSNPRPSPNSPAKPLQSSSHTKPPDPLGAAISSLDPLPSLASKVLSPLTSKLFQHPESHSPKASATHGKATTAPHKPTAPPEHGGLGTSKDHGKATIPAPAPASPKPKPSTKGHIKATTAAPPPASPKPKPTTKSHGKAKTAAPPPASPKPEPPTKSHGKATTAAPPASPKPEPSTKGHGKPTTTVFPAPPKHDTTTKEHDPEPSTSHGKSGTTPTILHLEPPPKRPTTSPKDIPSPTAPAKSKGDPKLTSPVKADPPTSRPDPPKPLRTTHVPHVTTSSKGFVTSKHPATFSPTLHRPLESESGSISGIRIAITSAPPPNHLGLPSTTLSFSHKVTVIHGHTVTIPVGGIWPSGHSGVHGQPSGKGGCGENCGSQQSKLHPGYIIGPIVGVFVFLCLWFPVLWRIRRRRRLQARGTILQDESQDITEKSSKYRDATSPMEPSANWPGGQGGPSSSEPKTLGGRVAGTASYVWTKLRIPLQSSSALVDRETPGIFLEGESPIERGATVPRPSIGSDLTNLTLNPFWDPSDGDTSRRSSRTVSSGDPFSDTAAPEVESSRRRSAESGSSGDVSLLVFAQTRESVSTTSSVHPVSSSQSSDTDRSNRSASTFLNSASLYLQRNRPTSPLTIDGRSERLGPYLSALLDSTREGDRHMSWGGNRR